MARSTRSEAFLSDAQGRDNVSDAELALGSRRHLLRPASEDAGRHSSALICSLARRTSPSNFNSLAGVYRTPAIYVEGTAVLTNTPGRCVLIVVTVGPEAAYVIERIIDVAADEDGN